MSETTVNQENGLRTAKLNVPGGKDFFTQEAYKSLRTNLQFCGNDKHVIFITSALENEGKTTVTIQLAKSFAELGKRVLVLDADMRKSVMARRNAATADYTGLSEVLTGLKTFEECVYSAEKDKVHLLFAGKYPPNPVELLSNPTFSNLIETLRQSYDYILIDTPPLGAVIDAAVIATCCDGGLLVLSENSHYKQALRIIDQVNKSGCKLLGVVRNRVQHNRKSAYYKKRK